MQEHQMIYKKLKSIQEWLFPGICLLCDARIPSDKDFCSECEASLPRLTASCLQCAAPIALSDAAIHRCGQCQKRPPVFSRTRALFRYEPPIDQLMQGLKYHGKLDIARLLGIRLARFLAVQEGLDSELIVPVPLHPTRLRSRGYNQSLELARPVAKHLGISLDARCVQRVRSTPPQTHLPPKERQRNVRGAFAATNSVKGRRVAVIDDVMTTGHTVNALARCLRQAGAKNIEVWVVARA